MDLTYDYEHLGETTDVINELAAGNHPFFKQASTPVFFVKLAYTHTVPNLPLDNKDSVRK